MSASLSLNVICVVLLNSCAGDQNSQTKGLEHLPGLKVSSVAQAAQARRLALVVGVDNYQDSFWPALHFAGKDAQALSKALKDPKIGGFDEVTILSGADNTSLNRVRQALDALRIATQHHDDTVVVYFSSHGTLSPGPKGFSRVLVMNDTDHQKLEQTGLTLQELEKRFSDIPSTRKALVLASCHSGAGKSLFSSATKQAMQGLKSGTLPIETVSHAALIFSAAAFGQTAREDDNLGHDVYTFFLLEALTLGADYNGDGAVTASEAHDYARRQTYAFTNGKQIPTLEAEVVGTDPVILSGRLQGPGLPVLYSYAVGLEGAHLRVGGRDKGTFPGQMVIEPGPQKVEFIKDGEVFFSSQVNIRPGDRISAVVLLDREKPRWSVGVRAYGFTLLDNQLSGQLIEPLLGVGLNLRVRDWPTAHIDPLIDLHYAQAKQTVYPGSFAVLQDVQMLQFGLGAGAAADFLQTRFYIGPHISLLYLNRQIFVQQPVSVQRFATFMPGAVGGVTWGTGMFELHLEAQAHYLPLMLNEELRSVSTASLAAGAAWRF